MTQNKTARERARAAASLWYPGKADPDTETYRAHERAKMTALIQSCIEDAEAPLLARIAKLEAHFDNCSADKIVTLQLRVKELEAALTQIQAHNAEAINGYARGFMREAENDVRDAQKVAQKALGDVEK